MNLDSILNFCAGLKGSIQDFPFDEKTLAMKVQGKIYALIDVEKSEYINLKCDPEKAIALREQYSSVKGAYHMNKKYWNSIDLAGDIPDDELKKWIHHSIEQVVNKMPKKKQQEFYGTTEQE